MSVFIQLTALKRNGQDYNKSILVDVNKIVTPIVENELNNSIIKVDTDTYYSESYFENFETYEVDEDLDAINLLSSELFKGTIITQNGRPPIFPAALFIKSRVVGVVRPIDANSEFDYRVMAAKSPETFFVQENLATINS